MEKTQQFFTIQNFINEKIAPGIYSHGGFIEIKDLSNNILEIALSGACESCSIQAFTSESISNYLLDEFPDLDDVIVIENRTEDDNPTNHHSYTQTPIRKEDIQMEKTLGIIKPDAVRRGLTGLILARMEAEEFKIVELRMLHMTSEQAQQFYAVHKDRPFYKELCDTMSAGPVVALVLMGHNAVSRYRELMGATDPAKAMSGTLRAEFALSVGENSVHGSDSLENAKTEIEFFFPK